MRIIGSNFRAEAGAKRESRASSVPKMTAVPLIVEHFRYNPAFGACNVTIGIVNPIAGILGAAAACCVETCNTGSTACPRAVRSVIEHFFDNFIEEAFPIANPVGTPTAGIIRCTSARTHNFPFALF